MTALKERLESAEGNKERSIGKRYHEIFESATLSFVGRVAALRKFSSDYAESPYAALAKNKLTDLESQNSSSISDKK